MIFYFSAYKYIGIYSLYCNNRSILLNLSTSLSSFITKYCKILHYYNDFSGNTIHLPDKDLFLILFITSSLRGHLFDLFLRNFLRFSFHSHSFCKFLAESEYDCTKDSYNCTDSDEERHFASFFIEVNEDHVKSSSY